ncbi:TatD family hydrolase [Saccharicrinis fermentans]|uniref:Putative deoxyribonuclease YjjV n=1 Tax=Saccharicrinis fermentans DSM 9555 = JCM 21142 TaxID=869213 RepID=W7Y5V0_9BACT|nr:TatD family hydrolase [Saccharicrinis fermentans]GAF03522.1 putative deoxyribonuclease YjjV [Saccharicrinis fermentans DSM 9555 = JCM 21142]
MFFDCHTHHYSVGDHVSVINYDPGDPIFRTVRLPICSCGIHPWYIHAYKIDNDLAQIESLCLHQKIVAIGECGLDKNTDDLELQKCVFERQIRLSERYELPLIIHSVKTHHIISEIRKRSKSKQPWIVHGYKGSIEMAQQFVKQNIFISFGENLLSHGHKFEMLLQQVNMDFVLFESDDSHISIVDVYEQAARLLCLDVRWLEKKIEMNFNTVFGCNELVRKNRTAFGSGEN